MLYRTFAESPLGRIALLGGDRGLAALQLGGWEPGAAPFPGAVREKDDLPLFDAVRRWLDDYWAGRKPDGRDLPLAPQGSVFARTVWDLLLEIPYGETRTYGEIAGLAARRLGRSRMAAQAVGGAVGANPVAIAIPCHRVMGARGNLTGYGGGLALKVRLLEHEKVDTSHFAMPAGNGSPRTRWS